VRWIRQEYDISDAGQSNTITYGYGCFMMVKRNASVSIATSKHCPTLSTTADDSQQQQQQQQQPEQQQHFVTYPLELKNFLITGLPTNLGRRMLSAQISIGPHTVCG
jgi:hypothetical protein